MERGSGGTGGIRKSFAELESGRFGVLEVDTSSQAVIASWRAGVEADGRFGGVEGGSEKARECDVEEEES